MIKFYKSSILIILSLLSITEGFAQSNRYSYNLKGVMPDKSYDNRIFLLVEHNMFNYDDNRVIDSVKVKDGQFLLTGSMTDTLEVASLELTNIESKDLFSLLEQTVFLEPGKATIVYDSLGISIKGTPTNESYDRLLLNKSREIRKETNQILRERERKEQDAALTTEEQDSINERLRALYIPYRNVHNQFVRENIHNIAGATFYFRYSPESYEQPDSSYFASHIDPSLLQSYKEKIERRKQEEKYFSDSQKQMSEGHHYRDIEGVTPKGEKVKLSDYIKPGKVVIIDFWASWCGPCLMEIPFLQRLYKEYHSSGLDIVSVSLDTSRSAWTNCLEKQQMEWPQMSDLLGWKGQAPKDYGISAIPFVLLLNREGVIVLRNLHDHLLEEAITKELTIVLPKI
jgi:thiol-disulfide isomerase/thioredoxin